MGSRMRFFHDGKTLYPILLNLIRGAKEEILLNFYTFNRDSIGSEFLGLLREKAREGVRVRVIFDALESRGMTEDVLCDLAQSGVSVKAFRPFRAYFFRHPITYFRRNHVRIFGIDRRIFGLGGICIGEIYFERDDFFVILELSDFRPISSFFDRLWVLSERSRGALKKAMELTTPEVRAGMTLLASGPMPQEQKIYEWVRDAVWAAKRRIHIVSTWFFPPRELLYDLVSAASRGVDVSVVTPFRTDKEHYDKFRALPIPYAVQNGIVWHGARNYFHHKFVIADDAWCTGSANFDLIAMKRNYELDICGKGGPILKELQRNYEHLVARSETARAAETAKPGKMKLVHRLFYTFLERVISV